MNSLKLATSRLLLKQATLDPNCAKLQRLVVLFLAPLDFAQWMWLETPWRPAHAYSGLGMRTRIQVFVCRQTKQIVCLFISSPSKYQVFADCLSVTHVFSACLLFASHSLVKWCHSSNSNCSERRDRAPFWQKFFPSLQEKCHPAIGLLQTFCAVK